MIRALVHYPDINTEQINWLRSKYDPQFSLINPHITIVFPISGLINEHLLITHIEGKLRHCQAFPVHLSGLERSWDDYLFLLLREGKEEVLRLHEAMYTGMLAPHRERNISFTPHITLGRFNADTERNAEAEKEAKGLTLDYKFKFDRVHLVEVNDERTRIVRSKEFLI